jgi:adenosylhomocysteine nucleosidase
MIAVSFALPAESSNFAALLREQDGKIDNRSVSIVHTGVGAKACARKIDKFLRDSHPEFLISSGFAGSVRDDLNAGDLITGENFSDRQLLLQAERACGARAVKLFTTSAMVDSIDERNQLAQAQGADAVDMETEIIAQACAVHGVRMVSLRVISDSAREPFPAPPHVLFDLERQRTNATKLASFLLRHPARIASFIRFANRIGRARKVLTGAIVAFLRGLDVN